MSSQSHSAAQLLTQPRRPAADEGDYLGTLRLAAGPELGPEAADEPPASGQQAQRSPLRSSAFSRTSERSGSGSGETELLHAGSGDEPCTLGQELMRGEQPGARPLVGAPLR
eukprot:COSAG04_NODE_1460_length_6620_cov_3.053366_2_plen_112_part_00